LQVGPVVRLLAPITGSSQCGLRSVVRWGSRVLLLQEAWGGQKVGSAPVWVERDAYQDTGRGDSDQPMRLALGEAPGRSSLASVPVVCG
jgi:hypothetical protein